MSDKENPKLVQAQKDGKAPLEYIVTEILDGDAAVHKLGADKYGIRNWRKDKIRASTYKGAILRHLKAWAEGEDIDPESGYSHLYHIRACCAIVLDSEMHDTLIDDRLLVQSLDVELPATFTFRDDIDEPVVAEPGQLIEVEPAEDFQAFGEQGFDAVFTVFAEDGSRKPEERRGPYQTIEQAQDYARRNPERLEGIAHIATHKPR